MRIIIYVDNNRYGKWSLLDILEPETEDNAGLYCFLDEESTWEDENRSELDVPTSGVYLADYNILPHVCGHPDCACDDAESEIKIIDEFSTKYIKKYFKNKSITT